MARMSRNKGKRGELEAAAFIRDTWGIDARRGRQYAGHPDAPDVVAALPGCHIEVKRREREQVSVWVAQAADDAGGHVPLVLHRKSRGEWLLTLRAKDVQEFVLQMHGTMEVKG